MTDKYWNEAAELMSADEIAKLQRERLVKLVKRVYDGVPHYRLKMEAAGMLPGDVKTLDDLTRLPFTTKESVGLYLTGK